jgi:hypothetical protein
MSVNEYFDRWPHDAARPRVSRRTADGYAWLLDRYLRPALGHRQSDKLLLLDIQAVYGKMQARGLSARVVRHKKSWSFEEPKTARRRRTVFLPTPLLQKLAAHKRKQAEARLKLGSTWQAFDSVFCSDEGTPLSIPNITYRYFRPILTKAELPRIRLYVLRHTCATLLLIAEENPKVVNERLGHSTIVLTLDTYSHVLPTMQQGATARLEKMLYKKRGSEAASRKEAS